MSLSSVRNNEGKVLLGHLYTQYEINIINYINVLYINNIYVCIYLLFIILTTTACQNTKLSIPTCIY